MSFNYSYSGMDADVAGMMKQMFGPMFAIYTIVMLAICVVMVIASWKLFVKSGRYGWKCLIPFYNSYCMFEMLYGNGWKFLLLLIPFYNIYVAIKFYFDLSKAFGQSTAFGFGLLFLCPIFCCILAFGNYDYVGDYPGEDLSVSNSVPVHKQTITRVNNSFEK